MFDADSDTDSQVQAVVRAGDTEADLLRKVTQASILGTWQATLTTWKEAQGGLRPIWRQNTEQERLLGVSLTGIMDNALTSGSCACLKYIVNALGCCSTLGSCSCVVLPDVVVCCASCRHATAPTKVWFLDGDSASTFACHMLKSARHYAGMQVNRAWLRWNARYSACAMLQPPLTQHKPLCLPSRQLQL